MLRSITWAVALSCWLSTCPSLAQNSEFIRGDCSNDGSVSIGDVITGLDVVFSGTAPSCSAACDLNDDDVLDISDPIWLLGYLFLSGNQPPPPFDTCGTDPTAGALDCQAPTPACDNLPEPPTIVTTPVLTATEGQLYSYDVDATDPNVGDVLTYSLPQAPLGAVVDPQSGEITWTPSVTQTGLHNFTVRVTDSTALTDEQNFAVDVTDVDQPPQFTTTPPATATAGAAWCYDADAVDPEDAGPVSYQLVSAPSGTFVDPTTGRIDWNPTSGHVGVQPFTLRATDATSAFGDQVFTVTVGDALTPPPDPSSLATPVPNTEPTEFSSSIAFLHEGATPIQTGVAPDVLESERVAVLRGTVTSRGGGPLDGVLVTICDHPEYGSTVTRADGMFDLAVNGGGQLVVNFSRDGFLTVQRHVDVPWQDFAFTEAVAMTALDTQVTAVDTAAAIPIQAAAGSLVTDVDGSRQATVLFPQGVVAEMELPDGSFVPLSTINVRVTEYTVGADGEAAMPATLPATSAYTYCAEFTVDEAEAAGAVGVHFSVPVPTYVENFISMPVGAPVPSGRYDRERGEWIGGEPGIVLEIVGVTTGMADLDLDGDGAADPAAAATLGITAAERTELASRYVVGQELWRVPLQHFSPHDFNYNVQCDGTCEPVGVRGFIDVSKKDPCEQKGSLLHVQTQAVVDDVEIVGTPFSLHYESDRQRGYHAKYEVQIPIIAPGTNTVGLIATRVIVEVDGRREVFFPPLSTTEMTYEWDGLDAYGRRNEGARSMKVTVTHLREGRYALCESFGYAGCVPTLVPSRQPYPISNSDTVFIGGLNADRLGLGGWSLSCHHRIDPATGYLVHGGGGGQDTLRTVIDTELLDMSPTALGGMDNDARRAIYFISQDLTVKRRDPDGTLTTVAGNGSSVPAPDGTPATMSGFFGLIDIAVAPDGALYILDVDIVRRVDPDGLMWAVAGTGIPGYNGDDIPATSAQLFGGTSIALGPDGSLYIADSFNKRVRQVSPDGIIRTVAGNGTFGFCDPTGLAVNAGVEPTTVECDRFGNVYIGTTFNSQVLLVQPNGEVSVFAGQCGALTESGDGGPAINAGLGLLISDLHVAEDGRVYVTTLPGRVRVIQTDGIIQTVAGTGEQSPTGGGDGGNPSAAVVQPTGVRVVPDGTIYIRESDRLRAIRGSVSFEDNTLIPSESGDALYIFDSTLRHSKTLHPLTGSLIHDFSYDAKGLLVSVMTGDGQQLTILRDASGSPTAIEGFYGRQTTLTLDGAGYLSGVGYPNGDSETFTCDVDGLMTGATDAALNSHTFVYDSAGRLLQDIDPLGNTQTLTRQELDDGHRVTVTSPLGAELSYVIEETATGGTRRVRTGANGDVVEAVSELDGTQQITAPDGTVAAGTRDSDARFGQTRPFEQNYSLTLPSGLHATRTSARSIVLADSADPLTLTSQTTTVDINGRVFTRFEDVANRTQVDTSAEGRTVTRSYDEQGRPTSVQADAALLPVLSTYDAVGRVSQESQGTQVVTYTYDALGRAVTSADAAGNTYTFGYDARDRLISQTLPSGRLYQFGYDGNGNLTQVIMPSGAVHALSVTALDQPATYAAPGALASSRSYDADRRLVQRVLPGGRIVARSYQGQRVSQITSPEATIDFLYGGAGPGGCCGGQNQGDRVSTLTRSTPLGTPLQTLAFTYDGQLVTQVQWSGAANGIYDYSYDNNLMLTGYSLDGAPLTTLGHDDDLRTTQHGPFALTRGGPEGRISQISDGVMIETISYDGQGRLATRSQTVNGIATYSATVTFDNVGNLTQKVETVGGVTQTIDYGYDVDGRLVTVSTNAVTTESYSYDANSNRVSTLSAVATYNIRDQVQTLGAASYTYDADGFLTDNGSVTASYGARGELLTATVAGSTISYEYDGRHRRVSRTDVAGVEQYLYGDPRVAHRLTASRDAGGVLTEYYYTDGGRLYALRRGGVWFYVASDQVGTPRVVTDALGVVVKTRVYDSYGILLADSNPAFPLVIGYATGLYDAATGWSHFGFRDYDPQSGTWTSPDPTLFYGSPRNLYGYVEGNPVSQFDPTGLATCFATGGGIPIGPVDANGGVTSCEDEEGTTICGSTGFAFGETLLPGSPTTVTSGGSAPPTGPNGKFKCRNKLETKWTDDLSFSLEFDDCGFSADCQVLFWSCSGGFGFPPRPVGAPQSAEISISGECCKKFRR